MGVIMCHMVHGILESREPSCISRSSPDQASDYPIEKASPPPNFFSLVEAIPEILEFRAFETVSLHFRFNNVEGVTTDPIDVPR